MRQNTSAFTSIVSCVLFGLAAGGAPAPAQQPGGNDPAAAAFLESCAPCHTIGGGPLTGPDLEGAAALDEATLRSEVERMQDYAGPLSEERIDLLVELLSAPDAGDRVERARGAAEAAREARAEIEEQGSPERGAALFAGTRRLTGGGLPCAACHRAAGTPPGGGGTFAADLTRSAERLGAAGLITAAEKASFPVMRAAYRDHPVTHDEAVDLAAFLLSLAPAAEDEAAPSAAGTSRSGCFPVESWGAGVALAGLLLIAGLYRGRTQRGGGVRRRLLRRATAGAPASSEHP